MSGLIVIRLETGGGRSRLELSPDATFKDLQDKIQERTSVAAADQVIAFDRGGNQPVSAAPTWAIKSVGIDKSGVQLFLVNSKNASIAAREATANPLAARLAALDAPKQPTNVVGGSGTISGKKVEPLTKEALWGQSSSSSSSSSAANTNGLSIPGIAGGNKPPQGSDVSSMNGAAASSNGAKGAGSTSEGEKKEPKHYAFEHFIKMRRFDTGGFALSNKYEPGTLVKGVMNKLPLSITLGHQKYRHVDHLEYMGMDEIQGFVRYWQSRDMIEQRGGWMYGYFRDDSHYPDGCRGVLEAIYEPQQAADFEKVHFSTMPCVTGLQQDTEHEMVDKIAERLGIEKIGWIYTGLPRDELLNSSEAIEITKLQLKYMHDPATSKTPHYSGYPVCKFLTAMVRPNPEQQGQPDTTVIQCSDQGMAMLRDGLLDLEAADKEPKFIKIRAPNKGELMPTVLQSSIDIKAEKGFDPDWFIVKVNDGVPKRKRSIFKYALFPVENRQGKPTRADLRTYFNKIPKTEPSWARFADFHLLLYLAKEFDVETVLLICDAIKERKEVMPGILEMFKEV